MEDALAGNLPDNDPPKEDTEHHNTIIAGYQKNPLMRTILQSPGNYPQFSVEENRAIRRTTPQGHNVTCIPNDRQLIMQILTKAHLIIGHFGDQQTAEYIHCWYWWPKIVKDTREFCRTCETCQLLKTPNIKTPGVSHPLPIPTKPWDSIGMDFVGPFPESQGHNYLWTIICRMTNMVHLIPINTRMKALELSWIYMKEIVRLHGLLSSIVSD